ncbi:uncharacterized protein LW93_2899 [Fusarium fujikuroi]|nr:uncharacterized protein LW93_2899 [Fusarium fujikuroi]
MDLFDFDDSDPDWYLEDSDSVWVDEDDEPEVRPRCCQCQFKFGLYDSIVVFNPENLDLGPIWDGKYSGNGENVSLENGYHSSCVNQFAVDFSLDDNIGDAICNVTRYRNFGDFVNEPLASFEANRLRRLKNMFAQEFMTIIGGRLPLEVCENIGGYCLSDYATRLYAARLFKDAWAKRGHFGARDAAVRVTKSHEVWAQHIEFEGIQYIKSLSTGRKSGSDTKLFEATDDTRVNIYFAEDPLGICEVVMTRDDNTVLAQGENLSWVINRGVALPFWFKPESDGLKLRDLAITKTKKADANYRQRRWAALPNHLRVCQLAQPPVYSGEKSKEPIRLVDWNLPGCRGYTVLIDMNSVCAIIPNSTRVPSSQLADAASRRALVSGGRVPQGNSLFAKYKNLIIRINRGRSFVLGSDIESRSTRKDVCKFTYQGIAALSLTQPTRMLYMAKPPRF